MAHEVVMPQMGESITEGTVTTWMKKVGDKVERDEPLFEISTDKVDAEIPSPVAGILLEIKVEPGATVPINSIVAIIGEEGEAAGAAEPEAEAAAKPEAEAAAKPEAKAAAKPEARAPAKAAPAKEAPHSAQAATPAARGSDAGGSSDRPHKSSPLVRKIAQEHSVDVGSLEGTGIGGRVTKTDIMAHLDQGGAPAKAAAPSAPAKQAAAPAGGGGSAPGPQAIPEAYRPKVFDGDKVEDLSKMRGMIADHMVLSKHVSAHVATVFEVDFEHVAKLRAKHKGNWEERYGVNLTFTAFIMKAVVESLKAFPVLNASLDGNKVIYHRDINLGIAVALDWGLIVPVVHKADELNLLGLTRRMADLANRARTKKLKPEEVQSGTFTITNPGIYGPMFGIPVINQPQVAIMGVGTVEKRPVVINDMIGIRTRAYLSMSFDHRLIDGAIADQFMARVKKGIEEFDANEL